MRLRKLAATLALGLTLAGAMLAQAAFEPQMTLDQLEAEVRLQRAAGQTIDAVAVAALAAPLEGDIVTTAMVLSGYTPLSVARAMLGAGALPVRICAGLLVAGVRLEEASEYFDDGVTGRPEACPPRPNGAGSPSEVTSGVAGSGSLGSSRVASPN
jgi:hypothetical protein